MEIPEHRTWMYSRLLPNRGGYVDEFLSGLNEFMNFACQQPKYLSEGVIRCPCKICKNEWHYKPDVVNVHILKKGFTPRYWYWTSHGEEAPRINVGDGMDSIPPARGDFDMHQEHVSRYQGMIYDAVRLQSRQQSEQNVDEPSDMNATMENFEKKKSDLSSQNSNINENDSGDVGQLQLMTSDTNIWVDTVDGKKKGRVVVLGSSGRKMKSFSFQSSNLYNMSDDVFERIKSTIHSLNASLQSQLEKQRQEKEEMKKELSEIRNILNHLMVQLGFTTGASSRPQLSPRDGRSPTHKSNKIQVKKMKR